MRSLRSRVEDAPPYLARSTTAPRNKPLTLHGAYDASHALHAESE
jgi:hypothetical protein